MTVFPQNASDQTVMAVVRHWVDVLAEGDYENVADNLGYVFAGNWSPVECIRFAISNYRSPDLYPGITSFSVSKWSDARGGNPEPRLEIIWYQQNSSGLAGAVSIDLPLNGKWSDLCADFVLFDRDPPESGYVLKLEEIY